MGMSESAVTEAREGEVHLEAGQGAQHLSDGWGTNKAETEPKAKLSQVGDKLTPEELQVLTLGKCSLTAPVGVWGMGIRRSKVVTTAVTREFALMKDEVGGPDWGWKSSHTNKHKGNSTTAYLAA
jgi:hypothetical protein